MIPVDTAQREGRERRREERVVGIKRNVRIIIFKKLYNNDQAI